MPHIEHSVERFMQPAATRAQVRVLAKVIAMQALEIAALTERVDQMQAYIEQLAPPGPIILTVGQEGSDQPDFQQDWTQYMPEWDDSANPGSSPPAPLQERSV